MIRRVVESRRRAQSGRVAISQRVVDAYVEQVMRLFAQMCGRMSSASVRDSTAVNPVSRWKGRRWSRPSRQLMGTWEAGSGNLIAVINSDQSGVLGRNGERMGRWQMSGPYLQFLAAGYEAMRFKWRCTEDGKALTLSTLEPMSGGG